jgi:mercuric ion transport protein
LQPRSTTASSRPLAGALGAVGGGVAALSCCVAPLVFVFVGISGAWIGHLTALSPYQPVFVAVAVGSIVYGHLARYRARRACAAGSGCTQPLPSRLAGIGLWTGTGLVAVALAANFAAPYLL